MSFKSSTIALLFLLLNILIAPPDISQAGGSIFSGLGYGTLEKYSSSRAVALGGAGIALPDTIAINFINPAILASLQTTRFTVGAYILSQRMRDQQNQDVDSWAQIEDIALALRLRRGLVLAFFLAPYSRVDFQYGWHGSLSGVSYYESFLGKGGLSHVSLDLAWAFSPWGNIGGGPSVIWGKVEELRGSYFDPSNYSDIEFLNKKRWLGFGWNLGLLVHPLQKLHFGAVFEPEIPIRLNQTFSYSNEDSTVTTEHDYRLAPKYGLGVAYSVTTRWQTLGQLLFSPWGSLHDLPTNSDGYQHSYDLSAGLEWSPGSWEADNFLARLQYRGGLRWESDYTKAQGSAVNAYFASLGIGIPVHHGRNRIDLALEVGTRGDLSVNGGQELLIKTRFGLNIGENWFVRAKPPWEK